MITLNKMDKKEPMAGRGGRFVTCKDSVVQYTIFFAINNRYLQLIHVYLREMRD